MVLIFDRYLNIASRRAVISLLFPERSIPFVVIYIAFNNWSVERLPF